jgi:hypothetical protein
MPLDLTSLRSASHLYDQAKAEQIEAILDAFRDDIRLLLARLEQLNRETD